MRPLPGILHGDELWALLAGFLCVLSRTVRPVTPPGLSINEASLRVADLDSSRKFGAAYAVAAVADPSGAPSCRSQR